MAMARHQTGASSPRPPSSSNASPPPTPSSTATARGSTTLHPSILQPRVAVVLNVPPPWHPWLFALRLLSCLPAVWWGLPSALHLVMRLYPGPNHYTIVPTFISQDEGDLTPHALIESALATIWCFACGYLSFFFTDCLMSRWLINYTPQATIVRLLTIDAVNAYVTLTVLSLFGGFNDPRLLLPGWISIATTLTVCYHITHQKINIRKETSTSINVFSIASYISMVTLLIRMLIYQPDYPTIPLIARVRWIWQEGMGIALRVKGSIERVEL
ncbi:hypothetical protein VHEMI07095 [[Torrubiella] hemipterigena]|uniref:N-glycosylation protein EOS1 n=1 Tax=[Torrubiella] hemipterigena TaxID=1531966 RepID=A0A0A1TM95_9HYPO|nr:hypothetical protein VHEMI07095 [[Torrubiella] hemipterigena]